MPLSRQSVETYPEMSSHATHQGKLGHSRLTSPLSTDPVLKSGLCVLELISTLKKKVQVANKWSSILPNPCKQGKSHHYHHR